MTTQEKNTAVAKMLGWKFEGIIIDFIPNTWKEEDITYYSTNHLKFDTDANWQFEAIEWIANNSKCTLSLPDFKKDFEGKCTAFISNRENMSYETAEGNSAKEAIFEALFKCSKLFKILK